MPIDSETFEQGGERYSIEDRILAFLQDDRNRAYNVHEIAEEVMDIGWSEANVEDQPDEADLFGWVLDVATVSSILDKLVDNGVLERRVVDVGEGERSYYRANYDPVE